MFLFQAGVSQDEKGRMQNEKQAKKSRALRARYRLRATSKSTHF